MKRSKTAKTILSLLMSMLLVLMAMPGVLAFNEGDIIADTLGMEKEFGTHLMSITAEGKTAGNITAASSSTDFYNYMEEKNTENSSAAFVSDATLGETVVELKSDKLASYNADMPFANAVGTITKGSTVYNQAYLGIAGASTKTDNNAARYDANDDLEQEYVFSVMFRAPKAENVSAWLFCGTNNQTSLNHTTLVNGTKFGRGIEITNGNVYLYNNGDGFSTAEGTAINTEALNADEWYRAIRIMKFPKNAKALEKVVILKEGTSGEYDTVVAQSYDWTTAENFSSSGNRFAHMFFIGEYPENYSGSKIAITDFDTYQVDYTAPEAVVDLDTQRVLSADFTGTGTDLYQNNTSMKVIADRFNGKLGKSQSIYVTFRVPDVEEASQIKFFRLNVKTANQGKHAGIPANSSSTNLVKAPYPDSFAVELKGNKLYANVYSTSSTLDTGSGTLSLTNLVELSGGGYYAQQEIYSGVNANEWYTLELKRSDITNVNAANTVNLYSGKVNRDEATGMITKAPVLSWGNTSDQIFTLPYVTAEAKATTEDKNSAMTYMAGANYSAAVDIDAISAQSWIDGSFSGNTGFINEYGVADNWTKGYATNGIVYGAADVSVGQKWHTFRVYGGGGNDPQDDTFSDNFISVKEAVSDVKSDYIATGTTASRVVNDIIIKYNAPISFNASDFELTYGSGQPVSINHVYDEAENTVTVEVNEKLRYGTDYTLTVNAVQSSQMGFDVEGQVWTFTCEDWFTAENLSIVDGNGQEFPELAVNTQIKANATFTNDSLETRSYVLILAVYKGNQMISAKPISGTIDSGVTLTNLQTEAVTITEEGCSAKAMLWDSFETLEPKIAPANLPVE